MVGRLAGLLLAAVLLATPAAAQERGQIEAGLFGRFEQLDRHLGLGDRPGLGGRLGLFFLPRLALEADVSYVSIGLAGQDHATVVPFHVRLLYDLPASDRVSILLGAGYSRHRYGGDLEETVSDDGFGVLAGFRVRHCGPFSFRLEGTLDRYGDPRLAVPDDAKADNWGVQFGASLFLGKKAVCDEDGDGVRDDRDECPGTPRGLAVDARGCPAPPRPAVLDSDGDGVPDRDDRCPGTRVGTRVDRDGCPQIFEEGRRELVLQDVFFETAQAILLPRSMDVLDGVAASLVDSPGLLIEVAGHTDDRGSREENLRLSQLRAEVVRDYLVGRGVPAARLTARGYGPDRPIAENDTTEGRSRNRRVELRRLD